MPLEEKTPELVRPKCGLVMPISPIDGMTAEHLLDVKSILKEVAEAEGFITEIVSAADESGIIQQRIVQNLYSNEIVICDVSGKNPNVMFELGLRLAFDKATIVVKDDKTNYSFDTSPIEHLEYPRDLRFTSIVIFKEALAKKLRATYKLSLDPGYSTFLKSFGTFNIQKLQEKDVSLNEYLMSAIDGIRKDISTLTVKPRTIQTKSLTERDGLMRDIIRIVREHIDDYLWKNNKLALDLNDDQKDAIVIGAMTKIARADYKNISPVIVAEIVNEYLKNLDI